MNLSSSRFMRKNNFILLFKAINEFLWFTFENLFHVLCVQLNLIFSYLFVQYLNNCGCNVFMQHWNSVWFVCLQRKIFLRNNLASTCRIACAALTLTNFFLLPDFVRTCSVQRLRSPVTLQRAAMRAQVSFVISELPLRLEPESVGLP